MPSLLFNIGIILLFALSNLGYANGIEHKITKRRAPVFLLPYVSEEETHLEEIDFKRAEHFPVPDQPLLPRRVLKNPDKGLIEGDIAGFTPESFRDFVRRRQELWKGIQAGRLSYSAIQDPKYHWTNGVVPYTISSRYAKDAKTKLAEAFAEYHRLTCIKFVKRTTQKDYIYIKPEGKYICASVIGRRGGQQTVLLGDKCFQKGTIVHELMHAVGFFHEQSRPDRDDWVEIKYRNIQSGTLQNFEKYPSSVINVLNTPYDYGSVMHYGAEYFSKNGLPTIVKKKPGPRMGQRDGFSSGDVNKLNILYECENKSPTTGTGITNPEPTSKAEKRQNRKNQRQTKRLTRKENRRNSRRGSGS